MTTIFHLAYNVTDIDAGFEIVRMTDPQLTSTMAEAVLAWTLYLHRNMPHYRAQQEATVTNMRPMPII